MKKIAFGFVLGSLATIAFPMSRAVVYGINRAIREVEAERNRRVVDLS